MMYFIIWYHIKKGNICASKKTLRKIWIIYVSKIKSKVKDIIHHES